MIKTLLGIRLRQIFREIIGIGIIRIIILFGIIGFSGLALYIKTADETISPYISIVFLVLVMLIHLRRKDKLFLKSHFFNYKAVMLTEYFSLSIPVITCLLIHKQWISLIPFSAILIIVNLDLRTRHSSLNTKLQALIPSDSFEWQAGLRKQFFIIIPIWIIASMTSFFIGSVPVAIFVLGLLTLSFFDSCEPYQVLLSYELSAKKLLLLKVKRQLQLFSLIIVPLIVLFSLFHIDKWYIPVAEYLIFCFLQVYVIMTKYAYYESNRKYPAAQMFTSIGILGGLIPIFLPAVWLLTIWFYLKSINNLNYYLDDYN